MLSETQVHATAIPLNKDWNLTSVCCLGLLTDASALPERWEWGVGEGNTIMRWVAAALEHIAVLSCWGQGIKMSHHMIQHGSERG